MERPTVYTGNDGRQVRVYVCDVCRKPFEWGPGALWYGSIADVEDCNWDEIAVLCSLQCKWRFEDSEKAGGVS